MTTTSNYVIPKDYEACWEAVKRGEEFIRSHSDLGVEALKRITPDMEERDGQKCALALASQTDYGTAKYRYNVSDDDARRYGFLSNDGVTSFDTLTMIWRSRVKTYREMKG